MLKIINIKYFFNSGDWFRLREKITATMLLKTNYT